VLLQFLPAGLHNLQAAAVMVIFSLEAYVMLVELHVKNVLLQLNVLNVGHQNLSSLEVSAHAHQIKLMLQVKTV
jgi:hypothetical protein